MKRKRRVLLAALMVFAMIMAVGCGKKFDASAYVKSVLDASFKGEFAQYIEMTNSTEEEATAMYNDNIDTVAADFESVGISEELQGKYREFFVKMLKEAKYTVGEAKEADDGTFTVDVQIEQVIIFDGLINELNERVLAYQEELKEEILNGGTAPSQEEIVEYVYTELYDLLNERITNPTYGDTQTVTVRVLLDDDTYYIPDEDFSGIENALYDLANAAGL